MSVLKPLRYLSLLVILIIMASKMMDHVTMTKALLRAEPLRDQGSQRCLFMVEMKSDADKRSYPADQEDESRRYSGLSALIQAATSQLGLDFLAEKDDGESTSDNSHPQQRTSLDESCTISHAFNPSLSHHQRFPEQLMALANDPKNVDLITFLPDGKFVAIRAEEFARDLMGRWFAVSVFDDFLELAHDWGYSCISDRECSIQVLRHPLFIQGDWEKCSRIKFGESPTKARLSALPARIKLDFAIDEQWNCLSAGKRRLSPGFIARRDSESSSISQRLKTKVSGAEIDKAESDDGDEGVGIARDDSNLTENKSFTSNSRHDELRSIALAITTSELRLTCSGSSTVSVSSTSPLQQARSPLVDRAVESATHTIVTDAIETLLRDNTHTQKTYLKHEKELSRSSLPGVVSLSKQLFSPTSPVAVTMMNVTGLATSEATQSSEANLTAVDSQSKTVCEHKSSNL